MATQAKRRMPCDATPDALGLAADRAWIARCVADRRRDVASAYIHEACLEAMSAGAGAARS